MAPASDEGSEPDDYMTMTFEEPSAKQETSVSRIARKKREVSLPQEHGCLRETPVFRLSSLYMACANAVV